MQGNKVNEETGLGNINASSVGIFEACKVRTAVRAILFNSEGNIALLSARGGTYYKIPGGGVEEGEDLLEALKREVLEESGAKITVENDLGAVVECGSDNMPFQISFGYICRTVGEIGLPAFTDNEKKENFKLLWVRLDEAIDLLNEEKHDNHYQEGVCRRELAFIRAAKMSQL